MTGSLNSLHIGCVWLLVCQSPSLGQRAFKASLLAPPRRDKTEPSICSKDLGSSVDLPPFGGGKGGQTHQPHPFVSLLNATASSQRGGFWGARGLWDLRGFISCPMGEEPGTSIALFRSLPCLSLSGARSHHSSPRLGSGSGYFFGQPPNPSHTLFSSIFPPQAWRLLLIKPNQSANKFQRESLKIPPAVLSSTLGGVPTSLGKQSGCGGREGESPLVNGIVPPGRASWLHLRDAGAGEGESRWHLPLPSDEFQVLPAPLCRSGGPEEEANLPLAHWELLTVGAGFLCLCHVSQRRGDLPTQAPL